MCLFFTIGCPFFTMMYGLMKGKKRPKQNNVNLTMSHFSSFSLLLNSNTCGNKLEEKIPFFNNVQDTQLMINFSIPETSTFTAFVKIWIRAQRFSNFPTCRDVLHQMRCRRSGRSGWWRSTQTHWWNLPCASTWRCWPAYDDLELHLECYLWIWWKEIKIETVHIFT